jgi:hypothetical protein
MVAKHVHAATITRLNQLARSESLPDETRAAIRDTLKTMFPGRISAYLFETTGQLRAAPFDASPLANLIANHRADLVAYIRQIFQQGWPQSDAEVATEESLAHHVDEMAKELDAVLRRVRRRLLWAFNEIQRLNRVREQNATLDMEDEAHFRRCDRLIKKLKGVQSRRRREAEGVDDINTYGVLAAEGFLPGYGLDTGSVVAMAEVPYWHLGSMDFDLPRPTSLALREYVPGNLIYANGHRFVARRFHRDIDGEQGRDAAVRGEYRPRGNHRNEHQPERRGALFQHSAGDPRVRRGSRAPVADFRRGRNPLPDVGGRLWPRARAAQRWHDVRLGRAPVVAPPRRPPASGQRRRVVAGRAGHSRAGVSGLHGLRSERLAAGVRNPIDELQGRPQRALRSQAGLDRLLRRHCGRLPGAARVRKTPRWRTACWRRSAWPRRGCSTCTWRTC